MLCCGGGNKGGVRVAGATETAELRGNGTAGGGNGRKSSITSTSSAILDDIHQTAENVQRSTQGGGSQTGITKNVTAVMARAHEKHIKLEDEYDLDKSVVLGTGFCGSVVLGKNKVTGQRVAVKSLRKDDYGDGDETPEEVATRVRGECEIYLNADHPNIVRLRDMYETPEVIYLVCDCCTGGEMYDRLMSRGQYTEAGAAGATKGMLLAVSYIHNTMKIVHRDLKLQNWLYPSAQSADDEVKLIDFGFSKVLENKKTVAVTAGTVEYLAPELLHHQSAVENTGDMWALGVIVFMLLGGYPPFSGKNNNEIIAAIRKHEIKWFRSRFEKVSVEAKSLVLGLLEADPSKRLTARQAIKHPWIAKLDQAESGLDEHQLNGDVLNALANFQKKTAFEKATAMIMAQCLGRSEVAALEKMFVKLDVSHEGTVELHELKQALAQMGDGATDIDDKKLSQIFDDLDYNHDHHIYFSDFLTAVVSCKIDQGSDKLIKATFDRFDVDNSGEISIQNLSSLFGSEFRNVPITELMKEVDTNGDEMISFEEFKTFIKERGKVKQTDMGTANQNAITTPKDEKPMAIEDLMAIGSELDIVVK
ncbi:unnamed protein product [Amoebophrya sp. A25]|nr:unnamed protein product [Amoebophrya sp. A25]|eukprot:GSA25T00020365001.1